MNFRERKKAKGFFQSFYAYDFVFQELSHCHLHVICPLHCGTTCPLGLHNNCSEHLLVLRLQCERTTYSTSLEPPQSQTLQKRSLLGCITILSTWQGFRYHMSVTSILISLNLNLLLMPLQIILTSCNLDTHVVCSRWSFILLQYITYQGDGFQTSLAQSLINIAKHTCHSM